MPKNTIYVNAYIPTEDEMALRIIGGYRRMNRSELVRLAVREFIERNHVTVTTLPRPEDGAVVPLVTYSAEMMGKSDGDQ